MWIRSFVFGLKIFRVISRNIWVGRTEPFHFKILQNTSKRVSFPFSKFSRRSSIETRIHSNELQEGKKSYRLDSLTFKSTVHLLSLCGCLSKFTPYNIAREVPYNEPVDIVWVWLIAISYNPSEIIGRACNTAPWSQVKEHVTGTSYTKKKVPFRFLSNYQVTAIVFHCDKYSEGTFSSSCLVRLCQVSS